MNKLIFLVLACSLVLSSAGCIYTKIEYLGPVQVSTQHKLSSSDFKILGHVSVTGETELWFGAVLTDGKGYQALLKNAQKMGGPSWNIPLMWIINTSSGLSTPRASGKLPVSR